MKRNKKIDILKFFAVISIICAHVTPITTSSILTEKISLFLNIIGCLGVGIFFIISGYLFYDNKKSFKFFIKKKFVTIIIPWVFIGSIVFVMVFYFNNAISISNYLLFIVGYGSYLYYLVVLIILYIIYYKMKKNNLFLIITSLLSLMSIIITIIYGINQFSYLNVFNWMLYFNIGLYVKKNDRIDVIQNWCSKYLILNFSLLIIIILINMQYNFLIFYWSYNGLCIILLNLMLLIGFLQKIDFSNNKIIKYIGSNSLPMYLIHMPIAGIIVRITNYYNNIFLIAMRPVLVLVLTYITIYCSDLITKKIKTNIMRILIGLGRCES